MGAEAISERHITEMSVRRLVVFFWKGWGKGEKVTVEATKENMKRYGGRKSTEIGLCVVDIEIP